jgi:hypothetical protein
LLGLVLVEPIRPELRAQGEPSRRLGLADRRRVVDIDRKARSLLTGAVQVRKQFSAELLERAGIGRFGLAEAAEHDAAQRKIGRADDRQQLILLAVEPGCRRNRAADRAARRLVEPPRGRGQDAFFPHSDRDSTRSG